MQPATASRILLIDDHHIFNDSLKSLLVRQPDLTICGQAYQASDALTVIQRTQPHLILLDLNIQRTNGIDLGKTILAAYPTVRILMLTMYNQPKLLDEARRAGLHGYLLKDATTSRLLEGIRAVLSGQTYFDSTIAPPSDDPFDDGFAKRLNLSFREAEIVSLIRLGLSNEQIAVQLHLSVETVKTHRKNIHFKLGISKVTDLVRFAIENGL